MKETTYNNKPERAHILTSDSYGLDKVILELHLVIITLRIRHKRRKRVLFSTEE